MKYRIGSIGHSLRKKNPVKPCFMFLVCQNRERSLQIRRVSRDRLLIDAWYPQTDHTTPLFYLASRVPHQLRVPWEVPTPSAHYWASLAGTVIVIFCLYFVYVWFCNQKLQQINILLLTKWNKSPLPFGVVLSFSMCIRSHRPEVLCIHGPSETYPPNLRVYIKSLIWLLRSDNCF